MALGGVFRWRVLLNQMGLSRHSTVQCAKALKPPARGEMIMIKRFTMACPVAGHYVIYLRPDRIPIHSKELAWKFNIITRGDVTHKYHRLPDHLNADARLPSSSPLVSITATFLVHVPQNSECHQYSSLRLPTNHPQAQSRLPITCGLHPSLSLSMSTLPIASC
jgi:hypothetical protein